MGDQEGQEGESLAALKAILAKVAALLKPLQLNQEESIRLVEQLYGSVLEMDAKLAGEADEARKHSILSHIQDTTIRREGDRVVVEFPPARQSAPKADSAASTRPPALGNREGAAPQHEASPAGPETPVATPVPPAIADQKEPGAESDAKFDVAFAAAPEPRAADEQRAAGEPQTAAEPSTKARTDTTGASEAPAPKPRRSRASAPKRRADAPADASPDASGPVDPAPDSAPTSTSGPPSAE